MENKPKKTVIYSVGENDIIISLTYPKGGCVGEFAIINTPLGYQLRAYEDSWKILSECMDLFELLGSKSMRYVSMEQLAYMIQDIGYELWEL